MSEDWIAALVCILISVPSLGVTVASMWAMVRSGGVRDEYVLLLGSLMVADCGELVIFGFFVPAMTVGQSPVARELAGLRVGQLSLVFWFVNLYATLGLALDRYLSLARPLQNGRGGGQARTWALVAGPWVLAVLHTIPYWLNDCGFYYDPPSYAWAYTEGLCGVVMTYAVDLGLGCLTFAVVLGLNVATGLRLRRSRRVWAERRARPSPAEAQREAKEKRFFLQSLVNAFFFEFSIINFQVLSRAATEKWGWFLTTNVAWQLAHASNGYAYFILHPAIWKKLFCQKTPPGPAGTRLRTITVGSEGRTLQGPTSQGPGLVVQDCSQILTDQGQIHPGESVHAQDRGWALASLGQALQSRGRGQGRD